MKLLSVISLLTSLTVSFVSLSAQASPPPLGRTINKYFGEHVPLFILEKSINRQNIIIVYTKMDRNCRIVHDTSKNQPTFGIYWLDDGVRYDVAPTAREVLARMPVEPNINSKGVEDPTSFYVRLADLRKVNHDLADDRILVKAERKGANCVANAYVALKDNRMVRIISTFTDMSFNLMRFDVDVHSLTVVGHEADNSRVKVERKYDSSKRQPGRRSQHQ